jgi:hypothetical protein
MKISVIKSLAVFCTVVCLNTQVISQVFMAEAVFDDFFVEGDIVNMMRKTGYTSTSLSKLPVEIGTSIWTITNNLDQYVEDVKKLYYINEYDGSVLICGVTREDGYFVYAINFFLGNSYAVDRIMKLFSEYDMIFDRIENGQYIYVDIDGEDIAGSVGITDNGIVTFMYFELY